MSSSSSASSSSSSASSSSQDGEVGGGGGGGGDFEGPSSSRRRSGNGVWPEPFVEALALQVAIDASRSIGRIAAAPALASVFQVCTTWRAVSRSDLLWRNLCRRIWGRARRLHDTWREEFIHRHRTALNFRNGRYNYSTLDFDPAYTDADLSCRCLALSDFHLAVGFVDGTVRLFDLATRLHVSTCFPPHHGVLGHFSRAVSGIVLSRSRLVFASLFGDVHVAALDAGGPLDPVIPTRHVHLGELVSDGALVDFAGCSRWWVGLYAGVPGQAFRIWDGETEQPIFVGGSLTDPEAVIGWHMLTDLTDFVGRVRVTGQESAVACTSRRVIVFNLRSRGDVLGEQELGQGVMVGSLDANSEAYVMVDGRGVARVRRADNLEEVCRFMVRGRRVLGCMNWGYALMWTGSEIRAWEVEHHGLHLYNLQEGVGDLVAMVADDRHVAACNRDTTVHLWDFGAQ